ncbi:hypothetical protein [Spirosoma spitsbergense]|uniref:hypothetical protein n=1 Tax=Spirosoma spitsbergense TaxID=431554 RepID=UPI000375004F|nr:hypothetical protein [Spirosoma spitsbergense]
MDPLNKIERNTSLVNFTAVYIIIIALPLFLAFWMGTKKSSKGGNQKAISEQEALVKDMDVLQQYVVEINKQNDAIPKDADTDEVWNSWLSNAEQVNSNFAKKANDFLTKQGYTGARDRIRKNACNYLIQLTKERSNYLQKRKKLVGVQNESAAVKQLQGENGQLKMQAQGLQNSLDAMKLMAAAQAKQAGGGGGAQQSTTEIENLKWQLRFSDANCKKSQADILESYNDNLKRKQLYVIARQNFQLISQNARSSYTIQQLAIDKMQEIDRQMSHL